MKPALEIHRLMALVASALYLGALLAPYHMTAKSGEVPGFMILICGWMGVLGFSIAWFANFPLLFCIIKMAFGKPPSFKLSGIAFCVALTALLPMHNFNEVFGFYWDYIRGQALWLWLASFAVVWFWAWCVKREENRQEPPSD